MKIKITENIKTLIPYAPGKPMEEIERDYGLTESIKLASNENPLGPSPKAIEAITKNTSTLNRYPDGNGFYLKNALSKYHKINNSQIILGNGSNELLELAARTFMSPGNNAVMAAQSFAVYNSVTQAVGANIIQVPQKEYEYDLNKMAKVITADTRIIFIANPDNPTGSSIGKDALNLFLNRVPESVLVVLDEAYSGYEEREDFPESLNYITKKKNILILRTFSKIFGLAGLRIGYGMADEELIQHMNKVRQPFNTNSLAQLAAITALEDKEHLQKSKQLNQHGKEYLYGEFKRLHLSYIPTDANFILLEVGKGFEVYEQLLKKGIIVRPVGGYQFPKHIRVTVGLEHENKKFVYGLESVLKNE